MQLQGMFNPQKQRQQGFTGAINVMGQMVNVTNGVAQYQGKQYKVHGNGDMVYDDKNMIVGYIEGDTFKPLTEQKFEELKKNGLAEGSYS